MGLIKEGDKYAVLSDITGTEDHLGDMDFKVTGTREGVTAFQMDTKIKGVTAEIMTKALMQAREGRIHILNCMEEVIATPREELSEWAPRIHTLQIKQDRIRDLIGPGGKTIKSIQAESGATVNVEDSGVVTISSVDGASCQLAIKMVREITQEAEVGKLYLGIVTELLSSLAGEYVVVLSQCAYVASFCDAYEKKRGKKLRHYTAPGQEGRPPVLEEVERATCPPLARKALGEAGYAT